MLRDWEKKLCFKCFGIKIEDIALFCFYLANIMLQFGLLVPGPVGLHLIV